MDYEKIADQKSKRAILRYEHKLKLWQIALEKALLGVAFVALAYVGNIAIENYRSEAERNRFFLEKRLEAIQNIKANYEDLHGLFDKWTLDVQSTNIPDHYDSLYEDRVLRFDRECSKWSVLFSNRSKDRMNAYLWVHQGYRSLDFKSIREWDIEMLKDHRSFMVSVHHRFDADCQEAVGLEAEPREGAFRLDTKTHSDVSETGVDNYLFDSYERWKAERGD